MSLSNLRVSTKRFSSPVVTRFEAASKQRRMVEKMRRMPSAFFAEANNHRRVVQELQLIANRFRKGTFALPLRPHPICSPQ